MKLPFESFALMRFARRQQSYIAVAVAIYLAMWAVDRPAPIGATLLYTLSLCNIVMFMQDRLGFLYTRKRPLHTWLIYSPLLLVAATLGVMAVNAIEFPRHHVPDQTLWQFLAAGWKMPFTATVIFGVSSQLYRQMKEHLELRNRDLQRNLERESAARELQAQELQQAREIQQSLLPKQIPQVAGYEIECAWEPARIVGGDYFDVIRLGEAKLGICIADVVGKSVSAALLMASVQASVRAFASDSASPSVVCSRVNSVLCSSVSSGKFVTLFYGVLDAESATLTYTNAGHLFPILLQQNGKAMPLQNGGALLGVLPAWKYEDSVVQVQRGERILLFTDGITEAATASGEEFGENRLIAQARQYRAKSTSQLKNLLLNDVKHFCAAQLSDDATLIIISATAPIGATEVDISDQFVPTRSL